MENEENVVNEEVEVKEETISLAEYNELDDRFKRMLAEFENYKKKPKRKRWYLWNDYWRCCCNNASNNG